MAQEQGLEQSHKIVAGDRRLTMHLMGIWQGLRGGADYRVIAKDFLKALPPELWTDCCVVEMTDEGDWQMSRTGESLARHSGVNVAPALVADLPQDSLMAVSIREIKEAERTGAPILDEGEARDEQGRRILFRSILLPLVDDEGKMAKFLAGARCRVCPEDA